jgi:MraZ protein
MFRGSFEHTLDGKGRLSIPAKFREVLLGKGDDRIIITNFTVDGVRCLDVYPIDEWLRFEEEIRKKPKFERRMVMFQNYYLGGACECVVDNQGRISSATSCWFQPSKSFAFGTKRRGKRSSPTLKAV